MQVAGRWQSRAGQGRAEQVRTGQGRAGQAEWGIFSDIFGG